MPDITFHMLLANGLSAANFILLIWLIKRVGKLEGHAEYTRGYLKGLSEQVNRTHKQVT